MWLKRQDNPTDKELDDQSIVTKIIKCQQDPDINWSYGYPRVQTWLKKMYGLKVNHKRIYRLMKANGIQAKIREKKWKHFGRKEKYVVSENYLNRVFLHIPSKRFIKRKTTYVKTYTILFTCFDIRCIYEMKKTRLTAYFKRYTF
ncbi:IS3 family transposase [Peribacillus sp. NPDC096379]|uniref:IS3 family transposase n=1 Tax=Peribacillus sp. NPDC096379 TaxID=3364393 RepID=UPI0038123D16